MDYLIDYYAEKVQLNKIFNIDSIKDFEKCEETGQFILLGSFVDDITEDIKIDLLLTYPSGELKCELTRAKKGEKKKLFVKFL